MTLAGREKPNEFVPLPQPVKLSKQKEPDVLAGGGLEVFSVNWRETAKRTPQTNETCCFDRQGMRIGMTPRKNLPRFGSLCSGIPKGFIPNTRKVIPR